MRAVLVFCEGNHDVAFVVRSLGAVAQGKRSDAVIRDLPAPFGSGSRGIRGCIIEQHEKRRLEELQLHAAARAPIPTFEAMVRDPSGTLFFLIRCNGDGAARRTHGFIDELANIVTNFPESSDVERLAFAFTFDADESVDARERAFASSHAGLLRQRPPRHAQWVEGTHGPVGLFVFHDPNTLTGTLEDVLAPMVGDQWAEKWNAAGVYLSTQAQPSDRLLRRPADGKKAQIGVTGQFMFPGGPMTEVIRSRERGLSRERFKGPVSHALVEFLRGVPW